MWACSVFSRFDNGFSVVLVALPDSMICVVGLGTSDDGRSEQGEFMRFESGMSQGMIEQTLAAVKVTNEMHARSALCTLSDSCVSVNVFLFHTCVVSCRVLVLRVVIQPASLFLLNLILA